MRGLIGLTESTDRREGAMRELSVLERMDGRMEQDKMAEMQAQQQEAMMFEKMYAEADKMLGKDRQRINKKIMLAQRQITQRLSETGGTRKDFMAQGGLSLLNNVGSDITQSDEAVRYKENKTNLARILEVKEKGMGHLLTPTDLRNLDAYEKNEDGAKITYSGVMNEVEIPPSNLFDYGQAITPKDVLDYGSNAIKIKTNYMQAYPDKPEPSYEQLVAFAQEMKYGGLGSNTTRLKEQAALRKKQMEYNAKNSSDPTKNKSFLYATERMMQQIPKDLKVADLVNVGENGYIDQLKKDNPLFNELLGERFKVYSRERSLGSASDGNDGFGELVDWIGNDKYGLKESYKLALTKKDQDAIVNEVMGGYMDENGMIKNYRPEVGEVYMSDGTKINERDGWVKRADDFTTDYRPLGITTALKSKTANTESGQEETRLLVNAYDDDGTYDEKNTQKFYAKQDGNFDTSDAQMTFVVAMQNEEGDVIYKEVDMNKAGIQNALRNAIPETDDITEITQQRDQTAQMNNAVDQLSAEEKANFQTTKRQMNQTVFENDMFKMQGDKYSAPNSGGQVNRNDMRKSFYMAFDYMNNSMQNPEDEYPIKEQTIQRAIDNDAFGAYVAAGGGMEESLMDFSPENKEVDMIDQWLTNINAGEENQQVIQRNQAFAQRWKQILAIN